MMKSSYYNNNKEDRITLLNEDINNINKWWSSPRWKGVHRPYTAEDVAKLRGSKDSRCISYPSNNMSKKLWSYLNNAKDNNTFLHTLGVIDPIQAIQVSKYVNVIYISGWQCSTTSTTNNETGPDFGDYPSNTVPDKVDLIFKAQTFHDRKQQLEIYNNDNNDAGVLVDYMKPIIADGDSGHGGISSVMRLMKMMIEKGAAGVHFEDQRASTKKCGHLSGKVLVSTREHIDRLIAARLMCDILGTDTIIIARTDAEIANLIDNNIDERDHPFILGASNPDVVNDDKAIRYLIDGAINKGESYKISDIENEWTNKAKLCTYPELISNKLKQMGLPHERWDSVSSNMGINEMKKEAKRLLGYKDDNELPYWCWECPRTREGYYRIRCGTKMCINRAKSFAPYSDIVWMEAKKPDYEQACQFTNGVRNESICDKDILFGYNLFPSLYWDSMGMSDNDIYEFQNKIGQLGFVWQFIPLAGFHVSGLYMDLLAKDYIKHNMLAYMNQIQRIERDNDNELLYHQKWSGADYIDEAISIITGGSSSTTTTSQVAHSSTERELEQQQQHHH